jgi:hypothetical protein
MIETLSDKQRQSLLEFGASKLALTACRRQAERTTGKARLAGQSKL